MSIGIFVIDDHMLLRQGIKQTLSLEEDFELLGDAGDAESALDAVSAMATKPDVILMDMNLPDMTGVDLAKEFVARRIKSKLVVLTVNDGAFYVVEMLKLGAKGYLLKGIEPELLVEAIRTVAVGGIYVDKELLDVVQELCGDESDLGKLARKFCNEQQDKRLTVREMEVLRCIAAGMSNVDMAEHLFVSDKTIKNHLTSIYKKLGVADRTQALLFAYKNGLIGEADGYMREKSF